MLSLPSAFHTPRVDGFALVAFGRGRLPHCLCDDVQGSVQSPAGCSDEALPALSLPIEASFRMGRSRKSGGAGRRGEKRNEGEIVQGRAGRAEQGNGNRQ